jgi:hypothetical protein
LFRFARQPNPFDAKSPGCSLETGRASDLKMTGRTGTPALVDSAPWARISRRDHGAIRANAISPGCVATPMVLAARSPEPDDETGRAALDAAMAKSQPLQRAGRPADIAAAAALLASDEALGSPDASWWSTRLDRCAGTRALKGAPQERSSRIYRFGSPDRAPRAMPALSLRACPGGDLSGLAAG